MAALSRPDIPSGDQRVLVDALHDLHHAAGWPSLRTIARQVGVSPTTVSAVFSAPRLPAWGLLCLVVEVLHGDVEEFHGLWMAASTPTHAPTSARIAGRRMELQAARHHLETGTGLLLVTGEAGIGKTRLVSAARADCGVFVATGAGLPLAVEVPFLPLIDALSKVLHADDEDWLPRALSTCPPYVPWTLAALLPDLPSHAGPTPPSVASARTRMFSAVRSALGALAERRPLALLLDDLHWADRDTLDLLEHLVADGLPVPLLGTFRIEDSGVPDEVQAWSRRIRRLPDVHTLELAPLTLAETAEQVESLHPRRPRASSPAGLVERIYARSRGLPLFTEQLVAHPDGPLPRLLEDLFGQRLAGLATDEHEVVTALAVADRVLAVDVLQTVTELPAPALTRCLRALAQRRLLADATDLVTLRHPLLAEAVRRELVPGEAAGMHRRLATALTGTSEAAEVAAHWRGAGDADQELKWRIRAARAARSRLAPVEEARQWQRALELWPGSDMDQREGLRRIDAAVARLDALEDSGQTLEAWRLLGPLLERVDTLSPLTAADILCRAASYGDLVSGVLPALAYAARAVALYETAPPGPGMVRALGEYAYCLHWAGRVTESLEVDRRLVAVCRTLGDAADLRRALVTHAAHLSGAGRSSEVRALVEEARAVPTDRPDPAGDVFIGVLETDRVLKFGGGPAALLAAGRPGLAAAERWQLDTHRAFGLRANVAIGLLRAGLVDEAAQLVDPHVAKASYVDGWVLHAVRIALDTVRGRLEEATSRLEALVTATPGVFDDREVVAIVTPCDLWAGRPDAALERLERALGDEVGSFDLVLTGECQVLAVRAAADLTGGEPRPDLRRRVADLLDGADPTDMTSEAQHAYRAARAAELSRLGTDPRPELWTSTAKEWDKINRPFESAYARWRAAQASLRTGQGTRAQRLLERAAASARGHVPLTEAIRTAQLHRTVSGS